MGAVNQKLAGVVEDHLWLASARDAPEMWSHIPATTIERVVPAQEFYEDLQLPPCRVVPNAVPFSISTGLDAEIPRPQAETACKIQGPPLQPLLKAHEVHDVPPAPTKQMPEAGSQEGPATHKHEGASTTSQACELQGRRKSLLIGINYYGSQSELHGCVDDVHRMLPVLEQLGFPHAEDDSSCRILLDSPDWRVDRRPTLANIRASIAWLVSEAKTGDTFFLHYSGHGGRMPRTDGRGEWHETLCPVDMDEAGMLLDTELFQSLVQPLPSGCRLTCILDACHSAGALDLPYIFMGTPENIKKALAGEARHDSHASALYRRAQPRTVSRCKIFKVQVALHQHRI